MPTKNENLNAYMVDGNGVLHKLNRIESPNIEPAFDSKKDSDMISQREMGNSFEICFKTPKTTVRSLLRAIMPNNWLKMHGYPMRRKGGKYESICNY